MANTVVFMGTPANALPVLGALLGAGHLIKGVYTQPDRPAGRGRGLEASPVKQEALLRGLPVYQPPSWRAPQALQGLAALSPDVIVVAAYGRILPPEVLRLPKYGCLNVHPSLLPHYRGPSPVVTALLDGEAATGVTIMAMDEGMDTGPVVAQRVVPVEDADTGDALTQRLFEVGADLLVESLPRWIKGELEAVPQDPGKATLTRRITKEDGLMDWRQPAAQLWRQVRALDPWPGAYTLWQGKLLKVLDASVAGGPGRGAPGQVFLLGEGRLGIATGDGVALEVRRLQLEGRRPLGVVEFLRGHPDLVGSRLPS
ncbi:MAG: methionyl-tRNA formyltransferase [Dehalococcoidia bacterium]|nr:methionyl-tRNA formyltransferase [Dehalococcoidia bacterium]